MQLHEEILLKEGYARQLSEAQVSLSEEKMKFDAQLKVKEASLEQSSERILEVETLLQKKQDYKPSEEPAKQSLEAQTEEWATKSSEKLSETHLEKPKLVQVEAQVEDIVPTEELIVTHTVPSSEATGASEERPVIAKKIRKEVEAFAKQEGFTKEQIEATRAKHAIEKGEASSVPIGTPTSTLTHKTRAAKAKATEKKMEEEITKKTVESQREESEEEIKQIRVNAKASFRSKKRLTRMLIGETESVQKETKMLIKKALGLILDEEEEKQIEEDSSKKLKVEELPKGVKIIYFELDDKYMYDDPIDTELIFIPNYNTRDNVDTTIGNIDVFDVDVHMFEQHEK
ncbi:uncharacterized protein LOC131858966 [Cryptomeria japonica]|uniref:uncharacterized protein LOC131858966 n=1 Tax=Cryptomeria japonica TaxID=3369 RepID=UPI0027DAB541|nr:uncharacterized protein LOC131858966 [Cryptomeria japonica]